MFIYFRAVLNKRSPRNSSTYLLFMETIINALFEIFSAHNVHQCVHQRFLFYLKWVIFLYNGYWSCWTMTTPGLWHMSTLKSLHVINTNNLMCQRPELIKSGFQKIGAIIWLLTLLIMYTLACLLIFTIGSVAYHSFFIKVFNTNYFVEDVNSWKWGTHEFHENWTTTNSNDSTV